MPDVSNRALFLDRDGVVNVDKGYVARMADFEWMPGIFDLARAARARGAALVIVTNQSGIARGYYTEDTYQALTAWMRARFEAEGAPLTAVYHCPHLHGPDGRDHPLRKPNPGMLLEAQADLDLDMAASALIGDKWTDIEAAQAAGVGHAAILGAHGRARTGDPAHAKVARLPDLAAARDWVTRIFG